MKFIFVHKILFLIINIIFLMLNIEIIYYFYAYILLEFLSDVIYNKTSSIPKAWRIEVIPSLVSYMHKEPIIITASK